MPRELWTPEKAKQMAVKSAETRRARAKGVPTNKPTSAANLGPLTVAAQPSKEHYISIETVRTRKQIKAMASLLEQAMLGEVYGSDAKGQLRVFSSADIERLTRALSQLRSQEQQLAGRPSPGAYRPEPPARRLGSLIAAPAGEITRHQVQDVSALDEQP